MIRISLNLKSHGTKKIEFFSQGTEDFKKLKCEPQYVGDYEYVNISSFSVLDKELRVEEDGDLHTDHPLSSFRFIQSKA